MRFAFIAKNADDGHCLSSGYVRSWMLAPEGIASTAIVRSANGQRRDMVVLAHVREQFILSLGSYGRSRMTEEL